MSPLALPEPLATLGTGSPSEIIIGTGTSIPPGVDAILEYNGLTMNNRHWLDTFIITNIDGLGDADIRDDRENNPQQHGETAFDSYYGGRPLILTGFVRSFTLNKLRDMGQALKAAFYELTEKPLVFHGVSFEASCEIWCKKNAPITWKEEQVRDDMFVRDFMISLRASNPRFLSLDNPLFAEDIGIVDDFSSDTSGSYEEF